MGKTYSVAECKNKQKRLQVLISKCIPSAIWFCCSCIKLWNFFLYFFSLGLIMWLDFIPWDVSKPHIEKLENTCALELILSCCLEHLSWVKNEDLPHKWWRHVTSFSHCLRQPQLKPFRIVPRQLCKKTST